MIGNLSGNKIPILTGRPTDDESKTGERININERRRVGKKFVRSFIAAGRNRNKKSYFKLIVLVLLALGGSSLYYLMKKPSKKKKKKKKKKK